MKFLDVMRECYESLPLKIRLFIGMLVAANSAGLAIYCCGKFIRADMDYRTCIGMFLMVRVFLFMANPAMPLTDKNVSFMSSERILWNTMTLLILAVVAIVTW
jgi:hypothetical protein